MTIPNFSNTARLLRGQGVDPNASRVEVIPLPRVRQLQQEGFTVTPYVGRVGGRPSTGLPSNVFAGPQPENIPLGFIAVVISRPRGIIPPVETVLNTRPAGDP